MDVFPLMPGTHVAFLSAPAGWFVHRIQHLGGSCSFPSRARGKSRLLMVRCAAFPRAASCWWRTLVEKGTAVVSEARPMVWRLSCNWLAERKASTLMPRSLLFSIGELRFFVSRIGKTRGAGGHGEISWQSRPRARPERTIRNHHRDRVGRAFWV